MAAYSEAQAASVKRYLAKFEEIKLRLKPELKDEVITEAAKHGESMQAYILRLITEDIEKNKTEK